MTDQQTHLCFLDEWLASERKRLGKFEVFWRRGYATDKVAYPMVMSTEELE